MARWLINLSDFSTIEADQRFSGRDFRIIVAARSEGETEIRTGEATGGRGDQGHPTRHASTLSAEEKTRVVPEGLRGDESIAELSCEGIASPMYALRG
jgi:hypothetical protein